MRKGMVPHSRSWSTEVPDMIATKSGRLVKLSEPKVEVASWRKAPNSTPRPAICCSRGARAPG
jgi:hypothetical protein